MDNQYAEKFKFVKTNGEFLGILENSGVPVLKKSTRQDITKIACPVYNNLDPVIRNDATDNKVLKIHQKCIGHQMIDIEKMHVSPESLRIRPLSNEWKTVLKKSILDCPAESLTRVPVMESTEKVGEFMALGGNHLLSAIEEVLKEEEGNEKYNCLRNIECDIYKDLNKEEAMLISAWHNQRCKQKKATFQDRVYLAHNILTAGGTKEGVRDTLNVLDNKKYTSQSLSTILSVARYKEENWQVVQELFQYFEEHWGCDISFPEPH